VSRKRKNGSRQGVSSYGIDVEGGIIDMLRMDAVDRVRVLLNHQA